MKIKTLIAAALLSANANAALNHNVSDLHTMALSDQQVVAMYFAGARDAVGARLAEDGKIAEAACVMSLNGSDFVDRLLENYFDLDSDLKAMHPVGFIRTYFAAICLEGKNT